MRAVCYWGLFYFTDQVAGGVTAGNQYPLLTLVQIHGFNGTKHLVNKSLMVGRYHHTSGNDCSMYC